MSTALRSVLSGTKPAGTTALPISNPAGTTGGGGGTAPGAGDTSAHSHTAAQNQNLARLSASVGHPTWIVGQEWQDWVSLWNQESGWDNLALNSNGGAFGIAQALGHGLPGTAGKYGNQYPSRAANDGDALAQIQWGISYIAQQYGSPSAAWAHEMSTSPHWY